MADLPLLPKGVEQAKDLARKLPRIDVAYAPQLKRNQETAHIISTKVVTDPHLSDPAYGGYEGQPAAKVIHQLNDHIKNKPSVPLPGVGPRSGLRGESFDAYKNRFLPAVAKVIAHADAHPEHNVAVVLNRRSINTIKGWQAKGSPKTNEVDSNIVVQKAGADLASFERTGKHDNLYLVRHGQTAWNEDPSVPTLKKLRDDK